jgi:tight adherence protein B
VIGFLAALLVAGGVVGVAYGLAERARNRHEMIKDLLNSELAEPSGEPERLAELVDRVGGFAERMLGRTSMAGNLERSLTRAGWALRPGEFGAVLALAMVAGGMVVWLLTGSVFGFVLGAAGVGFGVPLEVSRRGRKRIQRVEEQLPTVLQLLASSLDSGASVLQAMALVVDEGDAPISDEFSRVVAETKVGRPLLEALEGMAERIGSRDLDWTVEAIRIQHQTGGKLADTLRVLAGFMRARVEVRGEVRSLSAEAKLSARVLTGLPLVIAGYLFTFRRSYLEPLYTTSMGRVMIAVAITGLVVGTFWMRRLVRVEV